MSSQMLLERRRFNWCGLLRSVNTVFRDRFHGAIWELPKSTLRVDQPYWFFFENNEPFFSIFQIQELSKMMWSNLYSFRIGGCSSRKNVITQFWWTNTEALSAACDTNSAFTFNENTYGWLRERKMFVQSLKSFYASQTVKLFQKFFIQPPQAFVIQIMLNS